LDDLARPQSLTAGLSSERHWPFRIGLLSCRPHPREENAMDVNPYLMFDGRTEEALEFYKKALGAEVTGLMRFKENPDPKYNPPNSDDKVMHAAFKVGNQMLMASDGDCSGKGDFKGISLTLTVDSPADADKYFNALSEGGKVNMPLAKTFFSERFGMVADKFGVNWMVLAGE
jgi:PhnB protein